MRAVPVVAALVATMAGLAWVTEAHAEAVKATPELTVFTDDQGVSAETGPVVLRGSAVRRGTVDGRGRGVYETGGFQLGAGAKLWLTDPVSGQVAVCDERRSSRFGSRFIGCVEDVLPYPLYE